MQQLPLSTILSRMHDTSIILQRYTDEISQNTVYPQWIGTFNMPRSARITTLQSSHHLVTSSPRYRAEVLGLPGPIDRWLSTNSQTGGNISFLKDFIYLSNLSRTENVLCLVQRKIVPAIHNDTGLIDYPRYILYLTCTIASPRVPLPLRKSPRVFLDHFVGFPDELNAPDWVSWKQPSLKFYQPRSIIADTFAHLSTLDTNRLQEGLSAGMITWAKAITVDLWPTPSLSCGVNSHRRHILVPGGDKENAGLAAGPSVDVIDKYSEV